MADGEISTIQERPLKSPAQVAFEAAIAAQDCLQQQYLARRAEHASGWRRTLTRIFPVLRRTR